MVHLNIQFYYPTTQLAAVYLNTVVYLSGHRAFQYAKSILRNPNYVVLEMPEHMR